MRHTAIRQIGLNGVMEFGFPFVLNISRLIRFAYIAKLVCMSSFVAGRLKRIGLGPLSDKLKLDSLDLDETQK